jgi:hypothetical protein
MLTPKPYLSWSQLNLFESSPERYKNLYIFGEKLPINRGMAYGKQLAEGLEKEEMTGDPALDLVSNQIPAFEQREMRVEVDMKNGKEIIPLLIVMDTAKKDLTAFKEYKTAQTRWTKKQVDESGQITFYATAIWLKTGKIPQDIELVGIQTKKQLDGKIEATGEVYRIPTSRNIGDCLKMMVRIKKAWAGIQKLTAQEWL